MSEFPPEIEIQEPVDPEKLIAAFQRFKRAVFMQEDDSALEATEEDSDGDDGATILRLV